MSSHIRGCTKQPFRPYSTIVSSFASCPLRKHGCCWETIYILLLIVAQWPKSKSTSLLTFEMFCSPNPTSTEFLGLGLESSSQGARVAANRGCCPGGVVAFGFQEVGWADTAFWLGPREGVGTRSRSISSFPTPNLRTCMPKSIPKSIPESIPKIRKRTFRRGIPENL